MCPLFSMGDETLSPIEGFEENGLLQTDWLEPFFSQRYQFLAVLVGVQLGLERDPFIL